MQAEESKAKKSMEIYLTKEENGKILAKLTANYRCFEQNDPVGWCSSEQR